MNYRQLLYYTLSVVSIVGFCAVLLFSARLSSLRWEHLPFHSTIETLGGITSILIALVLYQENQVKSQDLFFMVATGFICMGVLDTFHAMSMPGEAFVFLHSVASLSGGFFFALIWLSPRVIAKYAVEQRWIAGAAFILSLSIGFRALIYPDHIPKITYLYNGQFTLVAILINAFASLLFLSSTHRFYLHYKQFQNSNSLIFMCLALLFGLSEMIFQFSSTWDGVWWSWHLFRLTAFVITLLFVSDRYLQMATKLSQQNHFEKEDDIIT